MTHADGQPVFRLHRQEGAVLVMALIFLVLLTVLAVGASGRSLLQERMAGSLRNAQLAQMAAESALRGAEWRLWTLGAQGGVDCSTLAGCYPYTPGQPHPKVKAFRESAGWVTDGAVEYKGESGGYDYTRLGSSRLGADEKAIATFVSNPRYIIEDLGLERPPGAGAQRESGVSGNASNGHLHIYRITARGVGRTADMVRVIESTFAAPGKEAYGEAEATVPPPSTSSPPSAWAPWG